MASHNTQDNTSSNETLEWIAETVKNLHQLNPMHELLKYATGANPEKFENEMRTRFNPNDDKGVDIAVEYLAALEDAIEELGKDEATNTLVLAKEVTDA